MTEQKLREQAGKKLTEDEYNAVANGSFLLGIATGLEQAAGRLRVQSGEMFADGRDQEARHTRSLSVLLQELHARARQEYDTRFPRK